MCLYLISDSEETALGLRLAGIEGTVVSDPGMVGEILEKVASNPEIAIILINQTLVSGSASAISAFRKEHTMPLITEIPDRQSDGTANSIADYVSEAIGIKI